ncbi:MAG: hypothetical protein WA269_07680 [Candidatus Udaeobacter sp.]
MISALERQAVDDLDCPNRAKFVVRLASKGAALGYDGNRPSGDQRRVENAYYLRV